MILLSFRQPEKRQKYKRKRFEGNKRHETVTESRRTVQGGTGKCAMTRPGAVR